jgi:hypothetical protein
MLKTKNPMTTPSHFFTFSIIVLSAVVLMSCGSEKKDETKSEETTAVAESNDLSVEKTTNVRFEVTEDKTALEEYYDLEHLKEWYPQRELPPAFDFDVNLDGKTVVELSLLRNEIFARNGYLFYDATLRGYFDQFKWYQPIFEVEDFVVRFNAREQAFVEKVLAKENELAAKRYIRQGDHDMISMDHVYNLVQFDVVDERLKQQLAVKNFAIVPANHSQFFHIYDQNHYQYIPNFITTDIYLQVMHKHFSTALQKIEEEKFIPLMSTLLDRLYRDALASQKTVDAQFIPAAQWTTAYLAIANHLLTGTAHVTPGMDDAYQTEITKVNEAGGASPSEFLSHDNFQYAQFKPRGNYTKTPELEAYFRCVKWLNSAPIMMEDDETFFSAVQIAALIKRSPENLKAFERFNGAIQMIVGDEDNESISGLIRLLSVQEASDPSKLGTPEKLEALRQKLAGLRVDHIRVKGGDKKTSEALERRTILFTAGRYTFDAEILSRLIHILRPDPKRTFPKGLDVFAALGNTEAKNILFNHYKEADVWPGFADSLKTVEKKFTAYNEWDRTIYTKTMEMINSITAKSPDKPLFMKTPSWQRKELNTSLAAWTELKHDMLLYAEQPGGAQAGQGGGPPPPQYVSYVEPNVIFWEKCLELLTFQEDALNKMDLMTEDVKGIIVDLKEIATLLLQVSRKELSGEKVTKEEFNQMGWIGGRIEYLTFRIFRSDYLPEAERFVAVVADVYNYNGEFLEEAVGMVDEIYVIAEINGKPHLTKGAVFSYYEFTSDTPLTDEGWRDQLVNGKPPERPTWMNDISVKAGSLGSKPTWSFE